MTELILKTGERIIPEQFESKEEYLLYLRHLFAYEFAKDNISKNSFVLEVGCGEGYGTSLISQNVKKIIGLDIDRNTIAHALKKYGAENCVFRIYDGVKIPYEDNYFDAVISFQAIEHIRDDINYISEIYRVLKRNGIFIITTPNKTYRLSLYQKPWNKFHIREYYPHELKNILKNKFSDIKMYGIYGSEEVQLIEIERVKKIKQDISIRSLIPKNFKKLIPVQVKSVIIEILMRITQIDKSNKNDMDILNKYNLMDCYMIKNNLKNSLDLLGICKK